MPELTDEIQRRSPEMPVRLVRAYVRYLKHLAPQLSQEELVELVDYVCDHIVQRRENDDIRLVHAYVTEQPSDADLMTILRNEVLSHPNAEADAAIIRVGRNFLDHPPPDRLYVNELVRALLQMFDAGEANLRSTIAMMRRCTIRLSSDEVRFVHDSVLLGLQWLAPTASDIKEFPTWVKRWACVAVAIAKELNPELRRGINTLTDWTSPIYEKAIAWLVRLGVFDGRNKPSAKTLDDWYREHQRATGALMRPGRPRKHLNPR